jgi:hypothetical protein
MLRLMPLMPYESVDIITASNCETLERNQEVVAMYR